MKDKLGQEPAFSHACANEQSHSIEYGMSKRFYAACAAMQGILASPKVFYLSSDVTTEANLTNKVKLSYMMADELLKQESDETN